MPATILPMPVAGTAELTEACAEKPLAIDLFCGLGGWTDGVLAEGYRVIGYDIEEHAYGEHRYQGELVIQDVLTLHGAQFRDAALIVASPPCQEYSYMAMPWKLAKAKAAAIRADQTGAELERLNRLFNACFRIQKEASIAAGRHIPMVVENVRGAIPWVGRSRYNFGSFHLWGDVPALMPVARGLAGIKVPGLVWLPPSDPRHVKDQGFNTVADRNHRTRPGNGVRFTSRDCGDERRHGVDQETGIKIGGDWFSDPTSTCRRHGSKSPQRKAASALIAKIPEPLARHIGRTFHP